MTEELKPVRCGCGGEAQVYETPLKDCEGYFVQCNDCRTATFIWLSEAEAITAWNRAIGERMAKAEYSNIDGEYLCKACGHVVQIEDEFCCGCGARLEWK